MSAPDPEAAARAAAAADVVAQVLRQGVETLAQVHLEHAAFRVEAARRCAERAGAQRAGAFGEAHRRLQVEIDAGRTTWAAVQGGADRSSEAVVAAGRLAANLATLLGGTEVPGSVSGRDGAVEQ